MSDRRFLLLLLVVTTGSALDLSSLLGIPQLSRSVDAPELPETLEIVRWRQPVCIVAEKGVAPCLDGLRAHQREYEELSGGGLEQKSVLGKKRLNVGEDEITPERESLVEAAPIADVDIRRKRRGDGRPGPIYVTKVLNSPVTAVLVARNCIPDIGVPLCEEQELSDEPTKVSIEVPLEPQSLGDDFAGGHQAERSMGEPVLLERGKNPEILHGVVDKKHAIAEALVAGKEAVVQDIFEKKQGVLQSIADKKHEVLEAIAEKKEAVVQSIIDKKNAAVQSIAEKKEQVLDVLASVAAKKDLVLEAIAEKKEAAVQGLVDKKDQVLGALAAKKDAAVQGLVDKKDLVIGAIVSAAAEKKAAVQGLIDKKKAVLQSIAESKEAAVLGLIDKKKAVLQSISETKEAAVQGLFDKKEAVLQKIVDAKEAAVQGIVGKKDQVLDALASAAAEKQAAIQGIVQKTKSVVRDLIDSKAVLEFDDIENKSDAVAVANPETLIAPEEIPDLGSFSDDARVELEADGNVDPEEQQPIDVELVPLDERSSGSNVLAAEDEVDGKETEI